MLMKPVNRWCVNREIARAATCRPMPPVTLSPCSPPVMTAVPVGISARRSRETAGLPAMSTIRS